MLQRMSALVVLTPESPLCLRLSLTNVCTLLCPGSCYYRAVAGDWHLCCRQLPLLRRSFGGLYCTRWLAPLTCGYHMYCFSHTVWHLRLHAASEI